MSRSHDPADVLRYVYVFVGSIKARKLCFRRIDVAFITKLDLFSHLDLISNLSNQWCGVDPQGHHAKEPHRTQNFFDSVEVE